MEIRLALAMGFCFGVKRAVSTARQAAVERGTVTTLGQLVHNEQVVRRLEDSGVRVAKSLRDIGGGPVIISAHGASQTVYEEAARCGLEVIDATCPIVRQIQRKARQLADQGFLVVIFGDHQHAEVRGVVGWTEGKAYVVGSAADLSNLPRARKVAVLSQSTLTQSSFTKLLSNLIEKRMGSIQQLEVHNTLCNSTTSAQAAALELAREVSVIIVVGGRDSANTRHLAELCTETGVVTHQVEEAGELCRDWFEAMDIVGITAGASTPDWVIEEIVARVEQIGRDQEEALAGDQRTNSFRADR